MNAGTLAGNDEAGHTVWDTGARGQEGDAHDDFWDAQGETDDGDLEWGTHERGWGGSKTYSVRCVQAHSIAMTATVCDCAPSSGQYK